jgi:tetratricopeptide (TPR) repeat protein
VIYYATRRRSLVENAVNLIGPTAITIVAFWAVFATQLIPYDADLVSRAVWFVGAIVFCTVTHELGHLFTGLLVHRPVRKLLIGRGATLFTARWGGVRVQVCANILSGGAVYFSSIDDTSRAEKIAVTAAGPVVNLLTGLVALALLPGGPPWMGTLVLVSMLLGAGNLYPSRFMAGGREVYTDGMRILHIALSRHETSNFFEGEDLTPDGERVTIRAIEEAMDSESDQVTDAHLLAVLDREPALHPILAPAHVAGLVRFPGPPNSLDVRPTRSPAVAQVYKVAFQVARDLGVSPPNAACICLGLMAVPSPLAAHLRDAGVSEAALREVAHASASTAPAPRHAPLLADLPLERWGSAADRVLALAFQVALVDRADETSTQHLIAAMVADRGCRAARALDRKGFVLHRNHQAVPPGEQRATPPPLSPEVQGAVAAALLRTGPTQPCGTGELLLGVAEQSRCMAAALLATSDIDAAALQDAIVAVPREQSELTGFTPPMRQVWELRARARLGAGRYADARQDYLLLEQHAPTDRHRAISQNNLAWVALMSGDPALHSEALERARAAVAVLPEMPSLQGTLAFALLENGVAGDAADILEKTVPRQSRLRDRALELCLLAMCRTRLGDRAAASRHIDEAARIDPGCVLLERARAELARSPILR